MGLRLMDRGVFHGTPAKCPNRGTLPVQATSTLHAAVKSIAAGIRPSLAPVTHQTQLTQARQSRSVAAAAAKRDDEELPIDVEILTVSSSSSSSSRRSSTPPSQDAATAAINAVDDAADAATTAVDQAADAATAAISDGSDAAVALVSDSAAAADAVLSDASDLAAAVVNDAAAMAQTAAAELTGEPARINWSPKAVSCLDDRFAELKVLVVGATGGVGRRVVEALRAKGVPCRALVRDRARGANLLPQPTNTTSDEGPEFDIVTGDVYQFATLPAAFAGCNAVVVASAANDKSDPFGPFNVDYQGTLNLIAAAKRAGVKRFVFVTSIGADDPFNPLNLFWGILFWKKRAEEELQRSGLSYTIVRPGGLKSKLGSGEAAGNIVMEGPNSFGFPPMKRSGAILRSQVADVCVEALVCPAAADKVVEVIADKSAPARTLEQLFELVII